MSVLPPKLQLMMPLTDEELVQRVLEGDSAVFELLMRRHNQRLFRLSRSVVRNDDEAQEIVQETYLRAYAHLNRFEGRAKVVTWLTRIAFHERFVAGVDDDWRAQPGIDLDVLPMNDPTPPGDRLLHGELRTTLAAALHVLPTGMRAIVMLRLVEGLSTRETAKSLRLTESHVKVALHRARRLLRDTIERQALPKLREEFSFAEERCDRIVVNVFKRLAGDSTRAQTLESLGVTHTHRD